MNEHEQSTNSADQDKVIDQLHTATEEALVGLKKMRDALTTIQAEYDNFDSVWHDTRARQGELMTQLRQQREMDPNRSPVSLNIRAISRMIFEHLSHEPGYSADDIRQDYHAVHGTFSNPSVRFRAPKAASKRTYEQMGILFRYQSIDLDGF